MLWHPSHEFSVGEKLRVSLYGNPSRAFGPGVMAPDAWVCLEEADHVTCAKHLDRLGGDKDVHTGPNLGQLTLGLLGLMGNRVICDRKFCIFPLFSLPGFNIMMKEKNVWVNTEAWDEDSVVWMGSLISSESLPPWFHGLRQDSIMFICSTL